MSAIHIGLISSKREIAFWLKKKNQTRGFVCRPFQKGGIAAAVNFEISAKKNRIINSIEFIRGDHDDCADREEHQVI